ncbi:hypothetical protein EH240_27745 [Mesorhizobium tamadayense]|uniref:Uncharacterized protein n=1 Tax=Mesorhizobium tamadayense TaxID=425306 RepID=A0A3P3F6P2_9HYPH|nr:hypothetical protein [Mesorhizobium tamadayense]RRH94271.1 hypothetical protein EH240_27745 [Mesorhizobium tamadayense]
MIKQQVEVVWIGAVPAKFTQFTLSRITIRNQAGDDDPGLPSAAPAMTNASIAASGNLIWAAADPRPVRLREVQRH